MRVLATCISKAEALEVIKSYRPPGCFVSRDNGVYVGIDNRTGDAWVEEFASLGDCLDWLGEKAEVQAELAKGRTLEEMLDFTDGQECLIFKADHFIPGDEVLYIPDIDLNGIPVATSLAEWSEEDMAELLSRCYTGDDSVAECGGDVEVASRLFLYCDWQHPSSAYPEVCGEEAE